MFKIVSPLHLVLGSQIYSPLWCSLIWVWQKKSKYVAEAANYGLIFLPFYPNFLQFKPFPPFPPQLLFIGPKQLTQKRTILQKQVNLQENSANPEPNNNLHWVYLCASNKSHFWSVIALESLFYLHQICIDFCTIIFHTKPLST